MPTYQLSQMTLVTHIMLGVEKQFPKATLAPHQLNACIEAANLVCAACARAPVLATPGMGLSRWLSCDDTGLSSMTMARVLCQASGQALDTSENPHPRDPDDFGRCHRFLEAVPRARPNLPQMATLSPTWKALVENWDRLTELYLSELPGGNFLLTAALMEKLGC